MFNLGSEEEMLELHNKKSFNCTDLKKMRELRYAFFQIYKDLISFDEYLHNQGRMFDNQIRNLTISELVEEFIQHITDQGDIEKSEILGFKEFMYEVISKASLLAYGQNYKEVKEQNKPIRATEFIQQITKFLFEIIPVRKSSYLLYLDTETPSAFSQFHKAIAEDLEIYQEYLFMLNTHYNEYVDNPENFPWEYGNFSLREFIDSTSYVDSLVYTINILNRRVKKLEKFEKNIIHSKRYNKMMNDLNTKYFSGKMENIVVLENGNIGFLIEINNDNLIDENEPEA